MQTIPIIFDRQLVRARRERAAARFVRHDFLVREVCDRLAERLEDISRSFSTALDLGCHTGQFAQVVGARGNIQTLVQCDISTRMVSQALPPRLVADEEFLPFADNSFDLVVSALSLHWVNDLPGSLIQIRRILKPDGLFLATLPGGETLRELRLAFSDASIAAQDGISPRVSPFVDVRDGGALLQRAGFALPVSDSDLLTVTYDNAFVLMQELRGMGESNALQQRLKQPTPRTALSAMAAQYQQHFANEEQRIPATFELVTLTGWKPHESQQQPARRGSGSVNIGEALK